MNWDRVEGNWKEFKGKVQQQWGKLTNDDLDVIEGKRLELVRPAAAALRLRQGAGRDVRSTRGSNGPPDGRRIVNLKGRGGLRRAATPLCNQ